MGALSWPVLAAVLFGALLHASWNALIKGGRDKALDTALIHGLGIVVALPVLLVVGLPPRAAWPYLAASVVVHLGYYVALVGAYRHGDLGLTYPVMRGSAPNSTAASTGQLSAPTAQRLSSSTGSSASLEWRMRVCESTPAMSRIG